MWLRDLLAACGVLPPYDPRLVRSEAWVKAKTGNLAADNRRVGSRFGQWHMLRQLRRYAAAGPITRTIDDGCRSRFNAAILLLEWADEHHWRAADLNQTQLDLYLAEHPNRRNVCTFVAWLRDTGENRRLTMTPRIPAMPHVTVPDDERWEAINVLLHDDNIPVDTRVAGLFVVLFAQPLSKVLAMTPDRIRLTDDGRVTATFDTTPVEMPPLLDTLITDLLATRGHSTYVALRNGWLFPGGIPGKPVTTENVRRQLAAHGIHHHQHRKAAMFSLAARIPAPILADLIGIATTTAVKWAALSARDWASYIRDRAEAVS